MCQNFTLFSLHRLQPTLLPIVFVPTLWILGTVWQPESDVSGLSSGREDRVGSAAWTTAPQENVIGIGGEKQCKFMPL